MGHINNTEPPGPYSETRVANAYCVSLLRELTELEIKTHCPGPDIQQVLNKGYKTKKGEHPAVDVAHLCESAQAATLPQPGELKQKTFLSLRLSGGWESEIQVWAGPDPPEASPLGVQAHTCCVLTWSSICACLWPHLLLL